MTGFEGTKQECDDVLIAIHVHLSVVQSHRNILYTNVSRYSYTIKHPEEDRYFAPIKKEKYNVWETEIDKVLTPDHVSKYGEIPEGFIVNE